MQTTEAAHAEIHIATVGSPLFHAIWGALNQYVDNQADDDAGPTAAEQVKIDAANAQIALMDQQMIEAAS